MLTFLLALACAATVGFVSHRASLCNVRAVVEVMNQGSAHMLGSFLQAVLWASLVAGVGIVLVGQSPTPVRMPMTIAWSLTGGWLFGVGAAVNGGCSLSTLNRLVDGELGMVLTLLGLALGVSLDVGLGPLNGGRNSIEWSVVAPIWVRWPAVVPWLLTALAFWGVERAWALWRLARTPSPSHQRGPARQPTYPHLLTATFMGSCAGILYLTQGSWSYTNYLRSSVLHAWTRSPMPSATHTLLVVALVLGIAASAWQRKSVSWGLPRRPWQWLRHAAGGVLMGAGAAIVPGGNDTMLLNALPTLAAQAVAAYFALLAGIASALWLFQRAGFPIPAVTCNAEGCAEGAVPGSGYQDTKAQACPSLPLVAPPTSVFPDPQPARPAKVRPF